MKRAGWLLSPPLFVCCWAFCISARATPQNSPQTLPKDPIALMTLAWQQNGLHGSDLQPWHVRASWQILDSKGKPEKQGKWEEWWAGPHESKTVYDTPDFQQTVWSSARGEFSLEGHGSSGGIEDLVEQMILHPVASQRDLGQLELKTSRVRDHSVELDCVTATGKKADGSVEESCFSAGAAALRTKITRVLEITLNSIVKFQARYVAEEMHVYRIGMPAIDIHIDQIESLSPGAESQLAPPPQAKLVLPWLGLSSGVIAGSRVSGEVPEYPFLAKQQYLQGTVSLWAVIGKDGAIHNLEVIGGPPMLQESSVNAVKTWHHKPYLLNGKPVEVHTQINVVYRLAH